MSKYQVGELVEITTEARKGERGIITEVIEPTPENGNDCALYNVENKDGKCIAYETLERNIKKPEMNMFEQVMFGQNTFNSDISNKNKTDEAFVEMAGRLPRDPSGKFKLVIAVGDRERNIPHFHVFRSEEDKELWKNGACLMFTENRYFDHGDNSETLTRDELEDIVTLLKKRYKRNNSISNWEQLVYLWNDNNDRFEIPDNIPMPEYDYKTITRYKETD